MGTHLYWVSALTYALVLALIMIGDYTVTAKADGVNKSYRVMTAWVIFFCLQDAVWGLCEARVIKGDIPFFISSSVFHVSTVITTFFWLKYVLDYLGDKVKHKTLYLIIDGIIISCEFILVTVNCFATTLFEIVDGNYITGDYRSLTFVNQYIVYFVIGVITLANYLKNRKSVASTYRTVFIYSLAPIIFGICQLWFPEAPFYSLGYFLGCFIIHIFVVAQEKEVFFSDEEKLKKITALNEQLENKQAEIDNQLSVLMSMAGAYDYINLVDLVSCTAYRFDSEKSKEDSFDLINDPHTALNKRMAPYIDEAHYDKFWDFTNLSVLDQKMKGRKLITSEFRNKDGSWFRALYIRIGEDVDKPITKVAYALRDITDDRRREQQVYMALTNLVYSLHVFDLEEDTMERLIESDIFKKIVGNEESAQRMSNTIIKATCKDEFLDIMLEFVDLSTVSERMKGQTSLNIEFVGKYHGWTRMTFVPIEMNGDKVKKLGVTTEIIDSEKNEMMNLIYKSSRDELTRLYNRRTYEEELDTITESKDMEDLYIVAMDVNGLKTVNDTLGHKAGDELIIGASKCIAQCLNLVGKTYRTGGDEFMAIIRCEEQKLSEAFAKFDRTIEEWSGYLVQSLSISYGYVKASDYPGLNIRELASEADKQMYIAKSEYYKKKGIDRRTT